MPPFLKVSKAIACATALGAGLMMVGFASDGWAKPRKPTAPAESDLLTSHAAPSPAPARFFTINSVLAKLDRQGTDRPADTRFASLAPADIAIDTPPVGIHPEIRGTEPFGLFAFRAPEGTLWRKWRGVESDIARDKEILNRCESDSAGCPSHAAQFMRLIHAVKSKSGIERLNEANLAVNIAIRYVSDIAQHGEADRWSAALATFASGRGDCEDFAIAKYVALSEAGIEPENLRLILVRDRAVREDHAVLAVRHEGKWLIMDNRNSMLTEDTDIASFTPLFAINHRGVQLFATPYAKREALENEADAMPATDSLGATEWTGAEAQVDALSAGGTTGSLPLLM